MKLLGCIIATVPKSQWKGIYEQFRDAGRLREVSYPGGVVLIKVGGKPITAGGKPITTGGKPNTAWGFSIRTLCLVNGSLSYSLDVLSREQASGSCTRIFFPVNLSLPRRLDFLVRIVYWSCSIQRLGRPVNNSQHLFCPVTSRLLLNL